MNTSKSLLTRIVLPVLLAAVAYSCNDGSLAPRSAQNRGIGIRASLGDAVEALLMPTLRRTSSLSSDIVVERTIGPSGGTIEIGSAGVKVTFPAGAVSSATRITMTAYAGDYVAYGFAPHGLTFNAPVTVRQKLKGTTADGLSLSILTGLAGGYLPNGLNDIGANGEATVAEVFPISIDLNGLLGGGTATFQIEHFSGYMVGWGKSGSGSKE